MSILIRGGTLLLGSGTSYEQRVGDIRIEGSQITALASSIEPQPQDTIIEAAGKLVAPGLVDLHTHLREPGREDEETIVTGAQAAAAGGFTTIVCMPNTTPPLDSAVAVEGVLARATGASVQVIPVGCISKGRQGKELAEIGELVEAGVWGVR